MTEMQHEVRYTNEHGEFTMDAEFSLTNALRMAQTLFSPPAPPAGSWADGLPPSWGRVTSVTITATDRPLDTRTIAEVEAQSVA